LNSRVADDPRRTECIRLLQQVEEEARRIFHPLRRSAASTQPHRSDRRA
jgi:preprotein translocase subunit SecE